MLTKISNKRRTLKSGALVGLICLLIVLFYYFGKVIIYEPVVINIKGLQSPEKQTLKIYGITPLNKEFDLRFDSKSQSWYYYYSFYRSINISISDSIYLKMNSIDITIGSKNILLQKAELKLLTSVGKSKSYAFPARVRSEKSLLNMLISPIHWKFFQNFIIIVLTIITLLLFLLFYKRIIYSFQSLYLAFNNLGKRGFSKITTWLKALINNVFKNIYDGIKNFNSLIKRDFTFHLYSKIIQLWPKVNNSGFWFKPLKYTWQSFITIRHFLLNSKKNLVLLIQRNNIRSRTLKRIIYGVIVSILIPLYLFYGYFFILFYSATYITSLLFMLLCVFILYYIILIILKFLKSSTKHILRLRISVLVLFFLWLAIESVLRIPLKYKSINERSNLPYTSFYRTRRNIKYMISAPYSKLHLKKKEYEYDHYYNSEGLRDIDHSIIKKADEYRIICLGNSYTEGLGAPQDSTWPHQLGIKLEKHNKNISVINAGVGGQDPFFEYVFFNERILKYKPDLLILTLQSSDFLFYCLRGGFERFSNYEKSLKKGPFWEGLFALSYIFRWYIMDIRNNNFLFLTPSEMNSQILKAEKDILSCIYKFKELSEKHHFKLFVAFIYVDFNTEKIGSQYYSPIIEHLKDTHDIPFVDIKEYLVQTEHTTNTDKYTWPLDFHYNSKGYEFLARGVEAKLKETGLLDSLKN